MSTPSLYEMLTFSFSGELPLEQVSERDQLILSVMDNMQRIINCRAGTLAHLPDYGLPDLSLIHQGMAAGIHGLMRQIEETLLRYEPRLMKRRTKNAKAFHDKCENFSFRASNETAVLITAFYSLHGDHLGYG
ncbi:TPA: type VI secretion system baseplate subunit TssE [Escherichia coli]